VILWNRQPTNLQILENKRNVKKNGNITCDQQKRNSNVQMNRRIWTFESTMHCIVRCAIYTTHTHTHYSFPQLALEHWKDMLQFSTNNSLCMDNLFKDQSHYLD
jgi:hypothetical protein